jgi:tetratricopeptide (TPR) repeat protein
MRIFVAAACALLVFSTPAHALHHHHRASHRVQGAAPRSGANLVTVNTAAGSITVASYLAQRFKALIADLAAHGYKPHNVGCYNSTGHVAYSRHYQGAACDFDQWGRNLTVPFMHHASAIIHKHGFRDGCDFGDCGHIDDGLHLRYLIPRPGPAQDCEQDQDQDLAVRGCTLVIDGRGEGIKQAAYVNRGVAYRQKGEFDKAIADYDHALKMNQKDTRAYYNRANAYFGKGELERALADYSRSIELTPTNANAYMNRGIVQRQRGEYDLAIADFNRVIQLNPSYEEAYYNRGGAFFDKGELEHAIADYSRFITASPKDAKAYINRGLVYRQKGEYDLAITDYNRAIELNPEEASAFNNRGNVYFDKREYDRAIEDYNRAIELNPKDADAYNNRASAYQNKG